MTSRQPPRRTHWHVLGVVGELMMTLGVVLLLFVVYQLWWTNRAADAQAAQAATELQEQWEQPPSDPDATSEARPELGSAFALAWIPRLRDSVWGLPINAGVDTESLARGLGHYPTSAAPGALGNFAIAGHRATNGEPLRNIDRLQVGDEVIIETRDSFYVYDLTSDKIVQPHENWVIQPVPGEPGTPPTQRLITVTTCHPRWASYERWIWWGVLTERVAKSSGEVPAALEAD